MMDFDSWWNSAAADAFRAQHEDMDGSVVRPVWDATMLASLPAPQAVQAIGAPEAFQALAAALAADPGYAWSWHCAVWASAHDEGMETGAANRAAARFMHMAFGIDTSKNANFNAEHLAAAPSPDGKAEQAEAPSVELDFYDEIECDLPYLFGRASLEGHEAGQRLAAQVRTKMQAARAALEASKQEAQDREDVEWFSRWIRNNYQDHATISGLCDAMVEAAHGRRSA